MAPAGHANSVKATATSRIGRLGLVSGAACGIETRFRRDSGRFYHGLHFPPMVADFIDERHEDCRGGCGRPHGPSADPRHSLDSRGRGSPAVEAGIAASSARMPARWPGRRPIGVGIGDDPLPGLRQGRRRARFHGPGGDRQGRGLRRRRASSMSSARPAVPPRTRRRSRPRRGTRPSSSRAI